jgi:hypothetical protein
MAWTNSRFFRATYADVFDNTTAVDLGSDVPKVALYNNTITPDQNVTSANTAYNVGQWVTAGEVSQAGQWAAGGVAVSGTSLNSATSGVVFYDTNDTASASAFTGSSITGCLVYDDTLTTPVADQGLSFHYFGGSNSITAGTFTVIWNSNGHWRATLN